MRADECLFMGEQRSCSGHRRKTDFDPPETLAAKIAVVHNAAIFSAMW